jgi:hypothetical protein
LEFRNVLYDPRQIKIMREALLNAEQALRFWHPSGLTDEMRQLLASVIIKAVRDRHTNYLVLTAIALRQHNASSGAYAA